VVQEEAAALAGGCGAAGTGGVEFGDEFIDDIDDPPPQALNTINKVHAAAGNQRR
jgi:hypothetical protein